MEKNSDQEKRGCGQNKCVGERIWSDATGSKKEVTRGGDGGHLGDIGQIKMGCTSGYRF